MKDGLNAVATTKEASDSKDAQDARSPNDKSAAFDATKFEKQYAFKKKDISTYDIKNLSEAAEETNVNPSILKKKKFF